MHITRTQNYQHLSLLDEDGRLRPKPILVCGTSGTGKSMTVEKIYEYLKTADKNTISIFFVDADDVMESAFSMFPATDKDHVSRLQFFKETPKAMDKVRLHWIYGNNLQKFGKKLPEGDIITFSAKKILQREEIMFLLEQPKETKSVRLMLNVGESLKQDEDLRFFRFHSKRLTERQKIFYMGKVIEPEDETIGDRSDTKDVYGCLHLFEHDACILPDNFRTNLNVKQLLSEAGATHVFIYKGLKQDKKLRDFIFFHIFNEFSRNVGDCKYQVLFVIEEAQSLAPDEKEGYKYIMGTVVGDKIGLLRKTARGLWILMVGRVWNKINSNVRSECKKQLLFHLEQDDMLKFVKVRSLTKKAKEIIENLRTGEFVLRGYETKIIIARPPNFSHKHVRYHFLEEYRKHYPKRYTDFSDIFKLIDTEHKVQGKKYAEAMQRDIEIRKSQIRRQEMQKSKQDTTRDKLNEIITAEKKRKENIKKDRDNEIINVWNELKSSPDMKQSYRNVAKVMEQKGIKVSYGTVKKIIHSLPTPESVEEIPVEKS